MTALFSTARRLCGNRRGSAVAEFGLIIPLWVTFFFGFAQVGMLFWASAGLQNGLSEGARQATLWPRATSASIVTAVKGKTFGVVQSNMAEPTVTFGTAGGDDYADITVAYNARMPVFGISVYRFRYQLRAYRS